MKYYILGDDDNSEYVEVSKEQFLRTLDILSDYEKKTNKQIFQHEISIKNQTNTLVKIGD